MAHSCVRFLPLQGDELYRIDRQKYERYMKQNYFDTSRLRKQLFMQSCRRSEAKTLKLSLHRDFVVLFFNIAKNMLGRFSLRDATWQNNEKFMFAIVLTDVFTFQSLNSV